jgi:hypothetical protein
LDANADPKNKLHDTKLNIYQYLLFLLTILLKVFKVNSSEIGKKPK